MAYTSFPREFYFELRYQGKPGVPFSDGLDFALADGKLVLHSQYRTNGTVVAYVIFWDSSLPSLTPFTVSGIKGCTETSAQIDPASSYYDYSYNDSIPTFFLNVTPVSAYTCHVYSGSSASNSISNATVEVRYDGNGKTYTGASDYVITASTDTSGNATLRWFSGSPTVYASKGTSSGTAIATSTASTTNIRLSAAAIGVKHTFSYAGYVVDSNSNPIAGAAVITGGGNLLLTDSNGYFSDGVSVFFDPGTISGSIMTKDYIPYSGDIESWCTSSSTYNTYTLDSPDRIEPYTVPDDKVLTLYDMWRMMSDQWHDINQALKGKRAYLLLSTVRDVFSGYTNTYCFKDSDTSPDFSSKPSSYCPTALSYASTTNTMAPANYICQKMLGHTYTPLFKLSGMTEYPFTFTYEYGKCNPYKSVNFPKVNFTWDMSYIKASFKSNPLSFKPIITLSASSWSEASSMITWGSGNAIVTSIAQASNAVEPIPYMGDGIMPLKWTLVFNESTNRVTISSDGDSLVVGNDNFTVTGYTVSRTSSDNGEKKAEVTISGTINLKNFANNFEFRIPVE